MSLRIVFFVLALGVYLSAEAISQSKKIISTTEDSVNIFIDSTFSIIQNKALYRDKIDWEKYSREIDKRKSSVTEFSDILPIFSELFNEMEDNHSFLIHKRKEYASELKGFDESKIRKPIMNELESGAIEIKIKKFLNGTVGYIQVPGDNTSDKFDAMQKASQKLQDSLCTLSSDKLQGIIVDLRLNTGGNMYPMVTGLSNLIGEGVFGSIVSKASGKNEDWEIKGNGTLSDGELISELITSCSGITSDLKVAILLSQITASSGEITALAFYKRKHTQFFGEPTAGYMTANELYYLPFKSYMLLAEGYEADRDGVVLKQIIPDVEMIDGDDFDDLSNDVKVQAAIKWIIKYN